MQDRKALLEVLNGQIPWRRPVWLMRQAGRYLPEYRALRREAGSFLTLCGSPEHACEVTLQPIRRYDLDAAIIFADILLVPWAMGTSLDFRENEGPVLSPVRDAAGVARLAADCVESERLTPVYAALRAVRERLPPHVALIGFCGAPWTVASYMVEGGTSHERVLARTAAIRGEAWFEALIDRLVEVSAGYLLRQVEAGAEALQIFDSWAGDLDDTLQRRWCIEPIRRILDRLERAGCRAPVIGFARGLGAGHPRFRDETGVAAVGVEQSVPVEFMARSLAGPAAVQGNLDPLVLEAGGEPMRKAAEALLGALPADRHVFNLGHGVRQTTPPENVTRLLDIVRKADG